MVKIRLRRTGKKNSPCYRLVVADSRSPRDGKFIEILGLYDPVRGEESLKTKRIDYWLSVGAQPTKTVSSIIRRIKANEKQKKSLKSVVREVKAKEAALKKNIKEESVKSAKGTTIEKIVVDKKEVSADKSKADEKKKLKSRKTKN